VAIAIATLHGKAGALAPAFDAAGIRLVEANGVDTDLLGTFTGEVPRTLSPLDAAIAKARLGMRATGLPVGVATEGSFGPDPVLGFLPLHREHIALVDDLRGIVVSEVIATHATNFDGRTFGAGEQPDADDFARWQLPSHAVIVRADPLADTVPLHKGLRDPEAVLRALDAARAASPSGRARIETDMRAHLNPTRMARIAELGERLVQRLASRCPACNGPGFGLADRRPGLACAGCGLPTALTRVELHGCPACGMLEERPRSDGLTAADPTHCDRCNP
jgi:hypothetical protein